MNSVIQIIIATVAIVFGIYIIQLLGHAFGWW